MPGREGVIVLMFDLPNETKQERHNYADFRKHIKRRGYIMIQKSVYVKYLKNNNASDAEIAYLDSFAPPAGSVSVLPMRLSGFVKLQNLRGVTFDVDLFSSEIISL